MKEPDEEPMTRGEYIRMMGKLLVLAFQGDLTHVPRSCSHLKDGEPRSDFMN